MTRAAISSSMQYSACGCIVLIPILLSGHMFPNFGIVSTPLLMCQLCISLSCIWQLSTHLLRHGTLLVKGHTLIKNIVLTLGTVILFHTIAVLYGAPLVGSFLETLHFALLLTSLTLVPCLVTLGTDTETWTRVFACNEPSIGPESQVSLTAVCSIIGAWLGAFPIPLDWDRPWQAWPITCVVGTICGHITGLIISPLYIIYRSMKEKGQKIV